MTRLAPADVLVRVWLPDRPGALGQVASRIGAVRGDIFSVDVLDRHPASVLVEFAVGLPATTLLEMLVREIGEVDGTSVAEVRTVTRFPDPRLDPLHAAERLCRARSVPQLHEVLTAEVIAVFLAAGALLLGGGRTLASAGVVVSPGELFAGGSEAEGLMAAGDDGPKVSPDVALAPLSVHEASLLVLREGHPFRGRELAQVAALARIADRVWSVIDGGVDRA